MLVIVSSYKCACNAKLPADVLFHFIGHLQSNKVVDVLGAPGVLAKFDTYSD